MPTPQIGVEGLDVLRRNLRTVDQQLPKQLTKIHREIAKPVADKAKLKVNTRSGRLAKSIRPGATQRSATITAGVGLRPYNYARINHYGGYPGNYPGNPFLTDAMDESEDEAIRLYQQRVHQFIETQWQDT